jgi:class 3 adenylate cyclase
MPQTRQLVAIMFTDIVGYTALMGNDEKNAFAILNKNRLLQKPIIEQFNGRWIIGEVVFENEDVFVDGVNIAARIH